MRDHQRIEQETTSVNQRQHGAALFSPQTDRTNSLLSPAQNAIMRMQAERGNTYVQRYLHVRQGSAGVIRRRARIVPSSLGDPRPGMMWNYDQETQQWGQIPAYNVDQNGVPIDQMKEIERENEYLNAPGGYTPASGPYQEYLPDDQNYTPAGPEDAPAEEQNYTPSEQPEEQSEDQA